LATAKPVVFTPVEHYKGNTIDRFTSCHFLVLRAFQTGLLGLRIVDLSDEEGGCNERGLVFEPFFGITEASDGISGTFSVITHPGLTGTGTQNGCWYFGSCQSWHAINEDGRVLETEETVWASESLHRLGMQGYCQSAEAK
jgi:hypothetical protein